MNRVKKRVSYTSVNNYLGYGVIADAIVVATAESGGSATLSPNTWGNIGAIPSEYHPNHNWTGIVALRNTAACSMARVDTNGIFACYNDAPNSVNYWTAMVVYTI